MWSRVFVTSFLVLVILANLVLAAMVSDEKDFKQKLEKKIRYDNYKVYKVRIVSVEQYNELMGQEEEYELDFWSEVHNYGETCDVMVKPELQSKFENFLQKAKIVYEVKIKNVQSLIDNEQPKIRSSSGMDWENFHTLDEIYEWLDVIAKRYPNIVTPFDIGYSYEGRLIKGIKISYKPGNKAVFIESNIHAREWITSATITYIIDELLVPRNPGVRKIAESVDWWIIPVLNVDGFVYSHEVNRMWRKSRLPSDPTGKCIGTDLNRNFDFLWMLTGASSDPCSETYAGPYAESDPEVKQMLQFINNTIPEGSIKIYISLHSYGQYVLSPWGHTDTEFPVHYEEMMHVAKGYADALYRRYQTKFTYGSSATTLYKVSGSGKEWAYGVKGIPIPYTIELRDKGEYGFILPPEMILPVAKEVLDGFVGMINAAQEINIV
ncbi:zinc carboxypeptidase [Cochliomyia hominivorax]